MSGTQRYALFVLLVVVVVLVYLLASGGFGDLTGGDDEPVTEAPVTENVLRVEGIRLGESQLVGPLEVTILGISFPDQIRAEGIWRRPAQRFASVLLTITNRSKQAVSLPLDGLQLITTDNRAYLADAALSQGAARTAESVTYAPPMTLQPQLTVNVAAVYDIPLDASGLQLRVGGGWTDFALFDGE